jgi:hypothetical protein
MELVFTPQGTPGEVVIGMYLDGALLTTQQFNDWTCPTFNVMISGMPRSPSDDVTAVFANLVVSTASPHNPGDANGDGRVDINDLTIVLTNFGQTGMTWSQGDFIGDGTVDINDLTIVLTDFGKTYSAAGVKAVPEPSTLLCFAAGMAGLLAYAFRKRTA